MPSAINGLDGVDERPAKLNEKLRQSTAKHSDIARVAMINAVAANASASMSTTTTPSSDATNNGNTAHSAPSNASDEHASSHDLAVVGSSNQENTTPPHTTLPATSNNIHSHDFAVARPSISSQENHFLSPSTSATSSAINPSQEAPTTIVPLNPNSQNGVPPPPSALPTVSVTASPLQLPQSGFLAPPPLTALGVTSQQTLAMTISNGIGPAPSDTSSNSAASTAPSSPRLKPVRQNSGTTTPRVRPPATTLSIPGMTKSRVSPDGKIAQRDVGAKLVIIMVGLPARGKSYITKKIQRYLKWQQYETRIFNVGNRRRIAAGASEHPGSPSRSPQSPNASSRAMRTGSIAGIIDAPTQAAHILLNGIDPYKFQEPEEPPRLPSADGMDQSAEFFDPHNEKAFQMREQLAMSTLDELLDFLLNEGGSVGILDATNSTIARRNRLFKHIKEREPKLGILFIESVCEDKKLLEANMHLKLRGPDYKDKDPESSLADFKKRVAAYESAYVPIGDFEEINNMQYIKLIDVGRKVVHFQLQGFLTGGIASYLSTFNLSPRQIWITRHGKSIDNELGRIGGNSDLTEEGEDYGVALYNFIDKKRYEWEQDQKKRATGSDLPLHAGDRTPPYPELLGELDEKNFCVWTSMLKRSYMTALSFDLDDNYDVKAWEMLNELNAGSHEGMTYEAIQQKCPEEYIKRKADKLNYIYPGVGGEGYLQVISRLRDMVRELERIKDHVLIIGHRSICRVLMAYFMDLTRDDIADLDVPLGMLYAIEPKPYGIDFHAYKYNPVTFEFHELPGYKPQKTADHGN